MRTHLVYDLPTRLFHWLFAGLFLTAYLIATFADHKSAAFPIHMLVGAVLCFVVLMRLLWGVVGTRHARFASFALRPHDAFDYFKSIAAGAKGKIWGGHNPASSWAAILMIGLALSLGITGYLMTAGGDREALEDVHEVLANVFLAVALLHIAGVALHVLRYRDGFPLSMIDGRKQLPDGHEAIPGAKAAAGLAMLVLAAGFAAYVAGNYSPASGTLRVFGQSLQLTEQEREQDAGHRAAAPGAASDHHDDR